jgi:colanic acid/amylovoran biosynthesis glycosyltransferase
VALTVVHSCPVWLPLTQSWMHHQVACVPDDIDARVVCERTENLDLFPAEVHALDRSPALARWGDLFLRRIRARRHLGFLARTGRAVGARIVHSHFGHHAWMDLGAVRAIGARHVATFYGVDVNRLPTGSAVWRARYRALFAEVDAVLCEGEHMAACIRALGCPAGKVRVQRLGVRVDDIPYRPRGWRGDGPLRVLMAATFRPKKGIPSGIEALAPLMRDDPRIELTLIGDAGPDPAARAEKARILAAIARHGLGTRVRLLGFQRPERLRAEAEAHHVFLAPSVTADDGDTEGGAPVTLIEMAASGMLIVSTTHCDIPNIIADGVHGLLAPEGDVDALRERLRQAIAEPGRWRGMLDAARERVRDEHDAGRQAGRLAAIYRELAGR